MSHCRGATPTDFRVLPAKIILVRHAESEGNADNFAYTYVPDPQMPLVRRLALNPAATQAWSGLHQLARDLSRAHWIKCAHKCIDSHSVGPLRGPSASKTTQTR